MKYFWISLFLLFSFNVSAQERLARVQSTSSNYLNTMKYSLDIQPNQKFINIQHDVRLISVNNPDGTFHRTFMVDNDGQTYSSGFMPATYFMPNNNLFVVSGKRYMKKDSYNPYGANDMTSVVVLSTINSLITMLKIKGR